MAGRPRNAAVSAGASDVARRAGVAIVGIPLVLLALYLGGWILGALVAAVAGVAVHELYGLSRARGIRPFEIAGIAGSVALVLLATARPTVADAAAPAAALVMLVALICLGAAVWLRWPGGEPLAAVGATITGMVYVGGSLAFIPLLRGLPYTAPGALTGNRWDATAFVLLPLLTTWANDTAAYFVGRAVGHRRLARDVSPAKSVEGAVAGLLAAMLVAVGVSWWSLSDLPFLAVHPLDAAWIGLLLGVAAQVGDLAESVLKREAGVKDSGRALPGHGGFLDRVDALLFAGPAAWFLLAVAGVL